MERGAASLGLLNVHRLLGLQRTILYRYLDPCARYVHMALQLMNQTATGSTDVHWEAVYICS
jgi:hypothetical protein